MVKTCRVYIADSDGRKCGRPATHIYHGSSIIMAVCDEHAERIRRNPALGPQLGGMGGLRLVAIGEEVTP